MEMETNSDDQCVGKSYGNHTHATCKEDIEVRKLRMQIPELARQGDSAGRQIFSSLIEQASDKVKAKMIQKNVSEMVYYHRKLLNNDPNTPCDPENLEIPPDLLNYKGRLFVMHDTGKGKRRIIILSTSNLLEFSNFTEEMYSNVLLQSEQDSPVGFEMLTNEYQFSAQDSGSSDSGNYSPNSASSSNDQITPPASWKPALQFGDDLNNTWQGDAGVSSNSHNNLNYSILCQLVNCQHNQTSTTISSSYITKTFQFQLKQENDILKKRVHCLEQENKQLLEERSNKKQQPAVTRISSPKKKLCLREIIMTLNYTLDQPCQNLCRLITNEHILLPEIMLARLMDTMWAQSILTPQYNISQNVSNVVRCPDAAINFLNTTQRIQLNNDLTSWIERHEKMNLVQLRRGNNPSLIFNSRTNLSALHGTINHPRIGLETGSRRRSTAAKKEAARLKAIRDRAWRHLDMISATKTTGMDAAAELTDERNESVLLPSSLVTFGPITGPRPTEPLPDSTTAKQEPNSAEGRHAIVVALKDYFLLPALNKGNTTSPPKISLILPAILSSNNSSSHNQITMMRIEAEVVGTGIFFLPELSSPCSIPLLQQFDEAFFYQ
uniref:Uncharacterized protein n=1 Tax=Ditylenchus dipsaci TaxID=166011 RepID=A0A915CTA1_9BILA